MMGCEMCGKSQVEYAIEIEGTSLKVCESCKEYGQTVSKLSTPTANTRRPVYKVVDRAEMLEFITEGFGQKIKSARERQNMTQEDFAKKINEKLSTYHNVESGHLTPNIALARKLERALSIKLVEQIETGPLHMKSQAPQSMTLGDVMRNKKIVK